MVNRLIENGKNILARRQTNILSAATIIMVAYAASGVLGLVRNRLLAARFFSGHEAQLDAYFAAFVLPDTVFQLLILGALSAAFIPVFTRYLKKDADEAWHVAQASMTIILALFLGVGTLLFIFAPFASFLLAPQFSQSQIQLMATIVRIMLVSQLFFAFSAFTTGVLQSHHRFLLPAIAPLFYNLGIIIGIIALTPMIGIFGPAVGVVIGAVMHFLIQFPLAKKLGLKIKFVFDPRHPGVRQMLRLMPPRAATLAIGQLERVIAVMFLSALEAGTLTIFNFARQLYVLPVNLFGATLGQASFPTLANEHEQDKDQFAATVANSVLQIAFFTLPAAALLLVLRIPIVRIAFGAKNFPWDATLLTGKAVAIFALSMPAQAMNQLFIRAFYASHNTKRPFFISMGTTATLVVLAPILVFGAKLGILGMTIAIVLADTLNTILLTMLLQRTIAPGLVQKLKASLLKMITASVLMAIFLWVPMRLLDQYVFDTTHTIPLLALTGTASIIGGSVYLLLSKLLKIKELQSVTEVMGRLKNWRKVLVSSEEVLESSKLEQPSESL